MGGDDELNLGKDAHQGADDALLPAGVQVQIHLVDENETPDVLQKIGVGAGVETHGAVGDVRHEAEDVLDAVAQLVESQHRPVLGCERDVPELEIPPGLAPSREVKRLVDGGVDNAKLAGGETTLVFLSVGDFLKPLPAHALEPVLEYADRGAGSQTVDVAIETVGLVGAFVRGEAAFVREAARVIEREHGSEDVGSFPPVARGGAFTQRCRLAGESRRSFQASSALRMRKLELPLDVFIADVTETDERCVALLPVPASLPAEASAVRLAESIGNAWVHVQGMHEMSAGDGESLERGGLAAAVGCGEGGHLTVETQLHRGERTEVRQLDRVDAEIEVGIIVHGGGCLNCRGLAESVNPLFLRISPEPCAAHPGHLLQRPQAGGLLVGEVMPLADLHSV